MRPITESANFSIAAESKNGIARITVTALDDKDDFLNFLEMNGSGINSARTGDSGTGIDLEFTQIGPGRYVAEHAIEGAGNLLYTIFPGEGYERLTAGINVPYSSEFTDRETNLALLNDLVNLKPTGGEAGVLLNGSLKLAGLDELLATNTFRPTLSASIGIQDIWPFLLVLCGTVFFADVFVRRVSFGFDWFFKGMHYLKSKIVSNTDDRPTVNINRLKSRKAEIEKQIEARRATVKFEPSENTKVSGQQKLEDVIASEIEKTPALPPKIKRDNLDVDDDTSYTSRLLAAKRKVQEQRKRSGGDKK